MDFLEEPKNHSDTAARHAPTALGQYRASLGQRIREWGEQLSHMVGPENRVVTAATKLWLRGIELKIEEIRKTLTELEGAHVSAWEILRLRIEKNSRYIEKHLRKIEFVFNKRKDGRLK